MKGIVIGVDGSVEVKDFTEPLYISVGESVGGWIEIVRPMKLHDPYIMIVNETGLLDHLPLNCIGTYLYGGFEHGSPIVGDIVIMKEGYTEEGADIIGLTDEEVEEVLNERAWD